MLKILVKILYRTALKKAHKVILLNTDDLTDLNHFKILDPRKAQLIPGIGVDLSFFYPCPPVVEPITFLFIGRMLREKGVYDLVDAAQIVRKKYSAVRFLLVGTIDINPGSVKKDELQEWHSKKIVEWFGQVNDVRPYIAQSSVFVLPSYREGLPRSTQEAMAMGRPVITTDSPGCRETVIDGKNGLIVPARNPEALAEAMEYFICNPEMIETMGRESQHMAKDRYDVININQKMMSLLVSKHQ